jgi:hypothetical protein
MTASIDSACMDVLRMDLDKFVKILRIELEHLGDHILLLMNAYHDRGPANLTDRVRQENLAVLTNEKTGVRLLVDVLDSVDVTAYETLDELTNSLKQSFERKLEEAGVARAAYLFAERKIAKVARYIQGSM